MRADKTFSLQQGKTEEWEQARHRQALIGDYLRAGFEDFIEAGAVLRLAYAREDWNTLSLPNFSEYCEGLGISKSLGYDLMSLAELRAQFPKLYPRMLEAGKSKMRLLIPRTLEATEESMAALLDDAATLSWQDLRQRYNGDDHEAEEKRGYVEARCPHCDRAIWLSREADIYSQRP